MIATIPSESKSVVKQRRRSPIRERAERILNETIEFVPNPIFERPDAEILIKALKPRSDRCAEHQQIQPPCGLPAYLAALYRFPLLSKHDESYVFCRMNYEKNLARRFQKQLDQRRPNVKLLDRIEAHLNEGWRIRNRIVQANLRLVVAIAKTFVEPTYTFDELVSEGHLPLIRAIELFDTTRGYRFSTYATQAIRNHFLRVRRNRQKRDALVFPAECFLFDEIPDRSTSVRTSEQQLTHQKKMLAKLLNTLPDRDRTIVSARFGLNGYGTPQTFAQIGRELGLSKERVRQLSMRAMTKLVDTANMIVTSRTESSNS